MARTQYAKNGEIHIAYQVHGNGPLDLVLCGGASTHLDVLWEEPGYRHFCEQLASFTRLIRFDKRGMGLSDRVRVGTLEERMEDDTRAPRDGCTGLAKGRLGAGLQHQPGNRVQVSARGSLKDGRWRGYGMTAGGRPGSPVDRFKPTRS